jgi:hypothetical protein
MPKLKNQLHEDFANAISQGKAPTETYRELCPSVKNPNTLGSRLWNRRDIRERVSEISEDAVEERNLTIKQKREMLRKPALGIVPTKLVVRPNGTEEIYDMLGAIMLDSRMAGHFSCDGKEPADSIKLTFTVPHRDYVDPNDELEPTEARIHTR